MAATLGDQGAARDPAVHQHRSALITAVVAHFDVTLPQNVMEYIDKRYAFMAEPSMNGNKKTTVYFEARCLVRIKQEHMDLHKFPFDTQDFEIGVEIEATDARDVRFIPYEDYQFEGGLPVGEADMLRCRFEDMDPVAAEAKYFVAAEIYETDRSKSRRGISYSGVKLQMRFRRLSRCASHIRIGGSAPSAAHARPASRRLPPPASRRLRSPQARPLTAGTI